MPCLADFPPVFLVSIAVALGLLFGSFLNVVIYRVPRGESIVWPGSHCPQCGKPIRAFDNLPVLSYVLLLGRARCCKAHISPRYPLIEAISGLYAYAVWTLLIEPLPGETSILMAAGLFSSSLALGLSLIAAAFIDLEHMYLPDPISYAGIVLGVLTIPIRHQITWTESLLGGVIGFVIVWLPFDRLYRLLRGRSGMGLGDAKLVALAGVWFGWQGALFVLFAGAMQGTLIILSVVLARGNIEEPEAVAQERAEAERALMAAEGEERERLAREIQADPVLATPPAKGLAAARVPFGPFLVLAILEYQLLGETVLWPWLLGGLD